MAWRHPVATVVIDATGQQGIGFGACDRLIVAVVVELGLHRVKEITIEDGGLLAGQDLDRAADRLRGWGRLHAAGPLDRCRSPKNLGPFQRVPVMAQAIFDRLG